MNAGLCKKHATDADPWAMEWCKNNHASGGAYRVERWQPGQEVVYVRNDDWKNGPMPKIRRVVMRIIPSAGNRRALLERGDADLSFDLPSKDFAELKKSPKLTVIGTPIENAMMYLGMNVNQKPFDNVKVRVPADRWVEVHRTARDELGLIYFSFLSAIEWSNEVASGYPLSEEVDERIELITTLGDLSEGRRVTFPTDLPTESPRIASLVDVFSGADWHEREAHEMFGIHFAGHLNLTHLYLPDGFAGNPLRKSFPLLSREVKPWPGDVDVEAMPDAAGGAAADEPTTENPEA